MLLDLMPSALDTNAKLMLTDWRGPPSWTANDLLRPGDLVSCGQTWGNVGYQAKPIAGRTTLVGGSLALATFNGGIPGSAGDAIFDICTEGVALGYDLLPMIPTGGGLVMARCRTYAGTDQGNGGNETWAWDLSRGEVCRWLALRMAQRYTWADGLHVDYWTALSAIAADPTLNPGYQGIDMTDDLYMQGMNRFVHEYRVQRGLLAQGAFIVGQQWQNNSNPTLEMRELNGRYVEQDPDRWGTNPWQTYHQAQFDAWAAATIPHAGAKSSMTLELSLRGGGYNDMPWPYDIPYQEAVIAFCSTNGCYCSWGRDSHAGEGWPG